MSGSKKISIIIPTYNRGEIAKKTFENAYNVMQSFQAELIIVNDYKKGSVKIPEHWKNVVYLDNPGQGAASARNYGAKHASSDLLLFVDDDILFSKENLSKILLLSEKYPRSCFNLNWKYTPEQLASASKTSFGRFIINVGLTDYKGWVPELNWSASRLFKAPKLSAFFLLIPKNIFEQCNGFNENFSFQGTEDDELSYKLRKNDISLYIEPNEYVIHNEPDKLNLINRLERLKNGAANHKKAFKMGFCEYKINYSLTKKIAYSMMLKVKKSMLSLASVIPNNQLFDPIYFRLVHFLIGTSIYEGYTKN